jgi:hypothetical protein
MVYFLSERRQTGSRKPVITGHTCQEERFPAAFLRKTPCLPWFQSRPPGRNQYDGSR